MKKILLSVTISIFLFMFILPNKVIDAQVSACPESMDTLERYNCLQKESEKLEQNQSSIQKKLNNEDYQQLSLNEKIKYINGQVAQAENVINALHLEILTQDIEINLLAKETQEMEDSLSILKQEMSLLQETVNKRVTESYKYSYVGFLELIMDIKNIDTVLRKTKYLIETRAKDKSALEQYNEKMTSLEDEETLLAQKKAELQLKRNDVEMEKVKLVEEKKNLDSQKAIQSSLLAESERRERQLRSQLETLSQIKLETDKVISDVAYKLLQEGKLGNGAPVVGGVSVIGRQGHTGCSFGSHLHFEIREANGARVDPANYLAINYGSRTLSSGYYSAMYTGAYITQTYSSHGYAIDMVTTTNGRQDGATYTVESGICSAVDGYLRSLGHNQGGLRGEGANIRAVSSGRVYYGQYETWKPSNPSKYALVKHNDGRVSFYLHIQ